MMVADRERLSTLVAPLLAAAAPENKHKLFKELRDILFPENSDSDIKMVARGRKLLAKLRDIDFTVTPL